MVTIIFLKKKHNTNGNPVYTVYIPEKSGKITGLRSLKAPHQYSFSSYNKVSYLKNYVFPKEKVVIKE